MFSKTLGTLATLITLGCVGCAAPITTAQAPTTPTSEEDAAVTPVGAERCIAMRRGEGGEVKDARLAERWPDRNYGTATASFAGAVGGAERATLLQFDLSQLPANAEVTRAEITLHKFVCGGEGVMAHRVMHAWDERSVTWASFDRAYDPAVAVALPQGEVGPGRVSFDATELVREWLHGTNHGLMLRQAEANTSFSTSEAAASEQRPTLTVCWTES